MNAVRVLIVDDNEMNVAIAQAALDGDNFTTDSAANASQAQQKIASFRPDLILMDIQMPGMDGLELTQLLKAEAATRHIVVVAFTAFAMRGDEEKMRAAGCDGYISKPIDVMKFGIQVRACLASSRAAVMASASLEAPRHS
jgi:two-component system cell cycle response regulator DivK